MPSIPQAEQNQGLPSYGPGTPSAQAIPRPRLPQMPGQALPTPGPMTPLQSVEMAGAELGVMKNIADGVMALALEGIKNTYRSNQQRMRTVYHTKLMESSEQISREELANSDGGGAGYQDRVSSRMDEWKKTVGDEILKDADDATKDEIETSVWLPGKSTVMTQARGSAWQMDRISAVSNMKLEHDNVVGVVQKLDLASDFIDINQTVHTAYENDTDLAETKLLSEKEAREVAKNNVHDVFVRKAEFDAYNNPSGLLTTLNMRMNMREALDPAVYDKEYIDAVSLTPEEALKVQRIATSQAKNGATLEAQLYQKAVQDNAKEYIISGKSTTGMETPESTVAGALARGIPLEKAREMGVTTQIATQAKSILVDSFSRWSDGIEGVGSAIINAKPSGLSPEEMAKATEAYEIALGQWGDITKDINAGDSADGVEKMMMIAGTPVESSKENVMIQKALGIPKSLISPWNREKRSALASYLTSGIPAGAPQIEKYFPKLPEHLKAFAADNPQSLGIQRSAIMSYLKEDLGDDFKDSMIALQKHEKLDPLMQFYVTYADMGMGQYATAINLLNAASDMDSKKLESLGKAKKDTLESSVISKFDGGVGRGIEPGDSLREDLLDLLSRGSAARNIMMGGGEKISKSVDEAYDILIGSVFEVQRVGPSGTPVTLPKGLSAPVPSRYKLEMVNKLASSNILTQYGPGPFAFSGPELGANTTVEYLTMEVITKALTDEIEIDSGIVPVGERRFAGDYMKREILNNSGVALSPSHNSLMLVDSNGTPFYYTKDSQYGAKGQMVVIPFDSIQNLNTRLELQSDVRNALQKKDAMLEVINLSIRQWEFMLEAGATNPELQKLRWQENELLNASREEVVRRSKENEPMTRQPIPEQLESFGWTSSLWKSRSFDITEKANKQNLDRQREEAARKNRKENLRQVVGPWSPPPPEE